MQSYGHTVATHVEPGEAVHPEIEHAAIEVLMRDLAQWAKATPGAISSVKYLRSEPIMREFYDEYDEDGNGIGPVTDVRWEVQYAWKATVI